jgi:7-carboxy-7-deazaguanine synthase
VAEGTLHIAELFYSLQGESSWAGYPCAFIRLAGCNLRCGYCDARYAWTQPGTPYSLAEIKNWLDHYPGVMVELTGGEPLLQEDIYPLLSGLIEARRKVLIETNGTMSIERIPSRASVILDIKCPDSGMSDKMDWNNLSRLAARREEGARDEIKFVLSSEKDFLWASNLIGEYRLDSLGTVLLSPVEYLFAPVHLAELIMEHRLPARLQIQLHRLLWPEKTSGA